MGVGWGWGVRRVTSVNGQADCLINWARCSSVPLSLVFASNSFPPISTFLHLSSYSYFLSLFFLALFVPSIPHIYFNHYHISCCLSSIYVFFLSNSFSFSSPSFFTTSLLLFSLLLATQFRSSHFLVLYSSFLSFFLPLFLPSFPSPFFPSAVRVFVVSIRFLSYFLLYCCLQAYFLFILLLLSLFFFPFLQLYSFVASLPYDVISRQHIDCAMLLQSPQHHQQHNGTSTVSTNGSCLQQQDCQRYKQVPPVNRTARWSPPATPIPAQYIKIHSITL